MSEASRKWMAAALAGHALRSSDKGAQGRSSTRASHLDPHAHPLLTQRHPHVLPESSLMAAAWFPPRKCEAAGQSARWGVSFVSDTERALRELGHYFCCQSAGVLLKPCSWWGWGFGGAGESLPKAGVAVVLESVDPQDQTVL